MHEQIKIEEEIREHAKLTLQTESNSNNIFMRFVNMFNSKAWGEKTTQTSIGKRQSINYNSVTLTSAKVRLSPHLKHTHEHSHACTQARDTRRCKGSGGKREGRVRLESFIVHH